MLNIVCGQFGSRTMPPPALAIPKRSLHTPAFLGQAFQRQSPLQSLALSSFEASMKTERLYVQVCLQCESLYFLCAGGRIDPHRFSACSFQGVRCMPRSSEFHCLGHTPAHALATRLRAAGVTPMSMERPVQSHLGCVVYLTSLST